MVSRHLRSTSRTAYGSRPSHILSSSPDAFLLRHLRHIASRRARTHWLSTGRFLSKMNWKFRLAEVEEGSAARMSELRDSRGNLIEDINRPSPLEAGGGLLMTKRLRKPESSV